MSGEAVTPGVGPKTVDTSSLTASPDATVQPDPNILSGHGHLEVGSYSPVTQVPAGTSVTVWTTHGQGISDALGGAIETGGEISVQLYPEVIGARTYLPGSFMPEYTLSPPVDPTLNIQGNPTVVSVPTPISALVHPNMGPVNWAACCVRLPPKG